MVSMSDLLANRIDECRGYESDKFPPFIKLREPLEIHVSFHVVVAETGSYSRLL
jgi:hypothetical protein